MLEALRQFFEAGLFVIIFAVAFAAVLLILQHQRQWETPHRILFTNFGLWSGTGFLVHLITEYNEGILFAVGLGMTVSFIFSKILLNYFFSGHLYLAIMILGFIFGIGWGLTFISTLPVSISTRLLMLCGFGSIIIYLPVEIIAFMPTNSYLFRKRWHRPRNPLPSKRRRHYPKVSLHVPCYAEPPDIVMSTLNALNRLQYPNLEVLVVDNNTKDPALWKPVEAHCRSLGTHFRFFHVDPLKGAKAGALNFALRHTAPDAELVGIIDSDYCVEPDFLERLVGFFDDPRIGYVQTPHDYRAWEANRFMRMCYWEYVPHYRLEIACLNEWVASYIIGTMALIRREALEKAGGWAEWCLTEDSECAVRIHALGYTSIFLSQTFGRGLIPETFSGYKKQRLRWTIGPIQQIKRHWRLYLPRPFCTPSLLSFWQKALELSHSLRETSSLISLLFLPFMLTAFVSMVYHQENIPVPDIIWATLFAGLFSVPARRWLVLRLAGCSSISDMVGSRIATSSLNYTILRGSLIGWLARHPLVWHRTSKFKAFPKGLKTLDSTVGELFFAFICIGISLSLTQKASYTPPDLLLFGALGMFLYGVRFLTAPLMALIGDRQINK